MTTKAHSTLTGSDLHEPKGAAGATAGQVYISDGAGSGVWTDTGATIGTSNFTTGDVKATFKNTADSGWVLMDDGTIGDLSSGGTSRANADTSALFQLLWNNIGNTYCAVSSGRGVSAAADFAAHKTISIPKALGRTFASSGTGSGLTAKPLGAFEGEQTHTLSVAETPVHTHTGTTGGVSNTHTHVTAAFNFGSSFGPLNGTSGSTGQLDSITSSAENTDHTHSFTSNGTGGGGAHQNIQPTIYGNFMVKL